jgi:CDGSH-type Zn-finger protein
MEPKVVQKAPLVQTAEPGVYFWCSCGLSKTQPFCDGAHKGTGMAPSRVEITERRTVAWCACKHSKNGACCDGSHKNLP